MYKAKSVRRVIHYGSLIHGAVATDNINEKKNRMHVPRPILLCHALKTQSAVRDRRSHTFYPSDWFYFSLHLHPHNEL